MLLIGEIEGALSHAEPPYSGIHSATDSDGVLPATILGGSGGLSKYVNQPYSPYSKPSYPSISLLTNSP